MLTYKLNSAGDAYTVVGFTDTSVKKIVIPDTYENLPVTKVSAFFGEAENLTEIIFGNNVKETGFDVLNIPSLEKVYFGRSIKSISGPFLDSTGLSHIYYSGTEEEWQNVEIFYPDTYIENFVKAEIHFGFLGKASYLTFGEETIFPYTHWDCVREKPESISADKITYDSSISGIEADNVKDALDKLNAAHFDITSIDSWKTLLYLVRSGRAKEFIKIGDQFVSMKSGQEIVWDVIGIDSDTPSDSDKKHSITLQMRDCFVNMPFSVPEATYFVFYPSGLSAGDYYIEVPDYDSPSKFYLFTLPEEIAVNSLIRICGNMVYVYSSKNNLPYLSFEVDSVSDSEEGLTGRCLSPSNFALHSEMGTIDYSKSDVRQWLNSDKIDWWKSSDLYSLAPLDYMSLAGFCNGMDEDFLEAVNPVKKKTILPDGREIITEDKFFLLSAEEVYAYGDGAYEYYKENASATEPSATKDAMRIKNFDGNARHWWLRTPAGKEGLMRVLTDGAVGAVRVSKILAYGIAPACCIC